MKLFIVACLVAVASAARLDNIYLPPSGAPGSGGSGSILNTPFRTGGSAFGSIGAFGSSSGFKSFPAPAPAHVPSGSFGVAGSYRSGPHIGIVRYDNNNDGLGRYQYAYETENRISAQEAGELRNAGSQNEANTVHGSYTYTGDDGVTITVNYVADENGFQPSGAHLPTPPPIPDAILKSLQFNAANPSANYDSGDDSGQYHHTSGFQSSTFQTPGLSRQYLAPVKTSFSTQSGYRY